MAEWTITRLRASHARVDVACGHASLDNFLRKLAGQYEKRRLGRTFVATAADDDRVAGYYTLAAGAMDVSALAESERKKFPKHPIPTIHLGRLAVEQSHRGKGLGETLLMHALKAAVDVSESLGAYAVDVWAIDESARAFYEKYGFISLVDSARRLFLPVKTISALFER
ncbi:MAG: GNAT family N-acetyltransferase [Planctomycetes bacterium]|nr:GNAT family N-acetyltransferase [Planctomycetota bacterium]